jgi:hypothetical protein
MNLPRRGRPARLNCPALLPKRHRVVVVAADVARGKAKTRSLGASVGASERTAPHAAASSPRACVGPRCANVTTCNDESLSLVPDAA